MNSESLSNTKDDGYNSKSNPIAMSDDEVKEKVHNIGRRVGDTVSQVANSTAGRFQLSKIYVKKHPVTGVVAATAVGMALGSVLTAALKK